MPSLRFHYPMFSPADLGDQHFHVPGYAEWVASHVGPVKSNPTMQMFVKYLTRRTQTVVNKMEAAGGYVEPSESSHMETWSKKQGKMDDLFEEKIERGDFDPWTKVVVGTPTQEVQKLQEESAMMQARARFLECQPFPFPKSIFQLFNSAMGMVCAFSTISLAAVLLVSFSRFSLRVGSGLLPAALIAWGEARNPEVVQRPGIFCLSIENAECNHLMNFPECKCFRLQDHETSAGVSVCGTSFQNLKVL